METLKGVNVAPTSTSGHYVQKAEEVILVDQINETFVVKGASLLVTKNHTTLQNEDSGLITCQNVYDPLAGKFVKSRD